MDEDMEYVFQAGGDACGICLALDGTNFTAQAHPNCSCQIVRKEGECEYNMEFHPPVQHGEGKYDFTIGGDLTVTCPDGTAVGQSVEWSALGFNPDAGWSDFVQQLIDDAVAELCSQCSESDPPLVV